MKINGWLIAAAFLVVVTFAWNRFWDYVIYLMESGVSIEPVMNTTTLAVGGLGLAILAFALVVLIRSETRTRERAGFLAIQLIAAIVCYLLWLWIRIPEEAGSPTLAVMSFMGWAIVAMPTWFAIGIVGIHYLSRMERT